MMRAIRCLKVTSRGAAATAAVLALLTGITACGSSGGSSNGSGGGKSDSTAALRFGVLSPNADLSPLYVGVAEGFFKQAGLDVTVTNFSGGGATSSAALASGSVDVASGGPGSFIGSIAKKAIHGKIFAELVDQSYDVVATKGINSLADLKGKTIGVSGINSNDMVYLVAVLKDAGISKDEVTFLKAGNPTDRYAALAAGKIDAIAEPDSQRDTSLKDGNVIVKAEDSSVRSPGQVFWATQDFLKSDSATLKSFMKVVVKSVGWIKQNKDKAAQDCAKGSGATVTVCSQAIDFLTGSSEAGKYTWSSTFAVNTKGIQQALDATSLLIPEVANLKVNDVVDTSITGTEP